VRYLRVGEAEGDNAFSISEFAAYCKAPTPFPPAMRVVEAPMAVQHSAVGDAAPEVVVQRPQPIGPLEIVLAIADHHPRGDCRWRPAARAAAAAPVPAAADASTAERWFPLVLLLFVGSGCAALMYEIIWFQLLQLVLGSSAVSIAVLLGTFMAGMCIGSLALARYIPTSRHPLRVYAVLELLIGASGLLMLVAMPAVQHIYTAVVGHGIPGLMLRGLFAAICLLPPTIMMGATLPAVARWVETTPRGVSWLGYFYGSNTIGAVFGCLLAGFYLLRVYDMPIATFVAVALNVVWWRPARWRWRAPSPARCPRTRFRTPAPPARDLPAQELAGLPGDRSVGHDGAGRRGDLDAPVFAAAQRHHLHLLDHPGGVSWSASALGSAAGSFLSRRRASPGPRARLRAARAGRHHRLDLLEHHQRPSLLAGEPALAPTAWFQFQIDFVRCLWTILPAALLWGASFPLALASVASAGQDGGRVVGRVYAANTVGAIIGAMATSLLLIGSVGTQNGQRIMIALAAVGALALLVPTWADGASRRASR
jgi:spermidine synthase